MVRFKHLVRMDELEKSIDTRLRRSVSAEAARHAQQERIEAISIEEGVEAALSMRERFGWLVPVFKGNAKHG